MLIGIIALSRPNQGLQLAFLVKKISVIIMTLCCDSGPIDKRGIIKFRACHHRGALGMGGLTYLYRKSEDI